MRNTWRSSIELLQFLLNDLQIERKMDPMLDSCLRVFSVENVANEFPRLDSCDLPGAAWRNQT
jgi:hypothetical protein